MTSFITDFDLHFFVFNFRLKLVSLPSNMHCRRPDDKETHSKERNSSARRDDTEVFKNNSLGSIGNEIQTKLTFPGDTPEHHRQGENENRFPLNERMNGYLGDEFSKIRILNTFVKINCVDSVSHLVGLSYTCLTYSEPTFITSRSLFEYFFNPEEFIIGKLCSRRPLIEEY